MANEQGVFVSYAPADAAIARRYIASLSKRGLDVWPSSEAPAQIAAGFQEIEMELEQRAALVVLLSQDALASPQVQRTVRVYQELMAGDRSRQAFLVRIAPCKLPTGLRSFERLDATSASFTAVIDAISTRLGASGGQSTLTRRALIAGAAVLAAGMTVGGALLVIRRHGNGALAQEPTPTPLPSFLPATLANLGFQGKVIGDVSVIIPPAVDVSAGSFLMGSVAKQDPQANGDEMPQTSITLPAFKIALCELTVAEYALAIAAKAAQPPVTIGTVSWQDQQKRPTHPVVNITWQDATNYAAWLAKVTGQPWRLPTEAEWEKAARGTDQRIYPWGNTWDKTKANTLEGGIQDTTPVGSYPAGASPSGALDMAGNVYEWVSSIYAPYPYKATDGRENPKDISSSRVLRGGSWIDPGADARTAARYFFAGVSIASSNVGTRLALGS
jgi:formylglycine-generating enzyme required for sulfatase activity